MCSIIHSSGRNRRIFSAIRPSASMPHLGNYIGMIRPLLDLQNAAAANNDRVLVCIADLHALTGACELKSVVNLRKSRRQIAAALLACGIDTKTTSLFYQSDIPELTRLSTILSNFVQAKSLLNSIHWNHRKNFESFGYLNYPLLMCSDILLYNSTHVPVGKDQECNINFANDVVRAFNSRTSENPKFAKLFNPIAVLGGNNSSIKDLRDSEIKMSKTSSHWNRDINLSDRLGTIGIFEDSNSIYRKLRKAKTDCLGSNITYEPLQRPEIANLVNIHSNLCGKTCEEIIENCKNNCLTTFKYKEMLADIIVTHFAVKRQIYEKFSSTDFEDHCLNLESGAENARQLATERMKLIDELLGFN